MRVVRRLALRDATGDWRKRSLSGGPDSVHGGCAARVLLRVWRSQPRERRFSWMVREAPDRRGRGVSLERTQR